MSRKEWNHAKLINFDKDGNLQLIDTWSDRSAVLPKPKGLNMKRNISEFLDRVNQTYTQNSKDLRYGQVVMNELYNYDQDAFNMNNGKEYDVYDNESTLGILLQFLEKKWKEDNETGCAVFWVLYRDNSWERKEFNVPLKILNNSTSKQVEWWVRDNNVFTGDLFKCIFSHSVYMNKE